MPALSTGGGRPTACTVSMPSILRARKYTVQASKDIVVRKANLETWFSYAKDWSVILKSLVCAKTLIMALPAVQGSEEETEREDISIKFMSENFW